ncbi:MAG: hypothetical protein KGD59_05415 [Candidatus Heimdallarchaeota archaeon]|nr:hypothetical protein [Candidatus Heimdallarchaeota archaeon]MBY8993969.1 hypothetical protein [Candidatus Heimdallarchaeota archaeon]
MFASHPINIINVIAGAVAITVSILILRKDVRATLNLLFFYSLCAWGISLVFNGLNFLYKHPTTGAGVIRDIVSGAGSIASFLIFATAFSMFKGEHYLKKWYVNFPLIILAFVNTIIGVIFDGVVYDSESGLNTGTGIKTTQDNAWVLIFLYLIPVVMIILANIYFAKTRKEVDDPIVKKRILFVILGFTLIVLGVLVFALNGVVDEIRPDSPWEIVFWIFATIFWIAGPILQLIGFNLGKISTKEEEEEEPTP